jgi:hypothetical protein
MFIVCVECPVCRVKKSFRQVNGRGGDRQQFIGQRAHLAEVIRHAVPQLEDLAGPDIVREPVVVDLGVPGLGIGADRERLLHVRRSLGPLGVPVGLHPGRQPAPAADRHRIGPLDLGR